MMEQLGSINMKMYCVDWRSIVSRKTYQLLRAKVRKVLADSQIFSCA